MEWFIPKDIIDVFILLVSVGVGVLVYKTLGK